MFVSQKLFEISKLDQVFLLKFKKVESESEAEGHSLE